MTGEQATIEDRELYEEILFVMQHYGSDAGERAEPGSKLRSQAARIVAFVTQRNIARDLLDAHQLYLVRVVRSGM